MTDGLLLIHAFPVDHRMWDQQRLGANTIAPDLPGFGGSEPAPQGLTSMAASAERCLRAADAAGLDRLVVCGLSLGGYVALELWRQVPERIAGLVLANTRSSADAPEAREARVALAERVRREGNVLATSPPPLLGIHAPEALVQTVRGWIADQTAEAIAAAALGMAARPDSTPDLPAIDVPTLVITSDLDTLIPPAISAPMGHQIPGARLEIIEGAGHLSNLEAPDRFNALVLDHCATCGVPLS